MKGDAPVNWRAEIEARKLREFFLRLRRNLPIMNINGPAASLGACYGLSLVIYFFGMLPAIRKRIFLSFSRL